MQIHLNEVVLHLVVFAVKCGDVMIIINQILWMLLVLIVLLVLFSCLLHVLLQHLPLVVLLVNNTFDLL
jgi:hypothetical protein